MVEELQPLPIGWCITTDEDAADWCANNYVQVRWWRSGIVTVSKVTDQGRPYQVGEGKTFLEAVQHAAEYKEKNP
jgi:hypothetical protein